MSNSFIKNAISKLVKDIPNKGKGSKIVIVKKGDGELFPMPKKYSDFLLHFFMVKKLRRKLKLFT